MKHNYGDCYYCGGEVKEKVIQIEHRWKGKLYLIDKVPVGVCQQCGEKYFTASVSKEIDRLVKTEGIKRIERVPVKEFADILGL